MSNIGVIELINKKVTRAMNKVDRARRILDLQWCFLSFHLSIFNVHKMLSIRQRRKTFHHAEIPITDGGSKDSRDGSSSTQGIIDVDAFLLIILDI